METEEYQSLHDLEAEHWFYRGRRKIVHEFVRRYGSPGPESRWVDIGTGCGIFLEEISKKHNTVGLEFSPEAIKFSAARVPQRLVRASANAVPLTDACADIVTAIDVLEHIEDDQQALQEIARVARGTIVITVPAMMFLWSDWDVALHHFRRYSRTQIRELAEGAGLKVVRCSYFNTILFPLIAAVRIAQKILPKRDSGERAEHALPPPWLNRMLYAIFSSTSLLRHQDLPFGVSILAVLEVRKPS